MKGSPVNLNKARKEKARDAGRRQADANAASYGRTKEQKELAARRTAQLRDRLEAHRRDRGETPEE